MVIHHSPHNNGCFQRTKHLLFALAFLFSFFVFFPKILFANTAQDAFLSPNDAFKLHVSYVDENHLALHFEIAPGYLLYRDQFQFRTLNGDPIVLPNTLFPPAVQKHDDVLNEHYEAYTTPLTVVIPTALLPKPQGLRVQYQGCAENGFCYAPIAKAVATEYPNHIQITEITPNAFQEKAVVSETDRITSQLESGSFPLTFVFFLGLGLLLSFTPCVLPMVPILANILVGSNAPLSSRRATFLAALYVLSVAVCYAIAGAVAGLMGSQLQQTLQKPGFLILLSVILVLFAFNQFGFLKIHLPQFFAQALHQLQHKQKQGSTLGAIGMGAISALMVSPCVTPALVGALTYIGQTGNAMLGGFALFAMALGMGLPLLFVASVGSHLLPKAGSWMNIIKWITGLLLLILAGSILVRAFPHHLYHNQTLEESYETAHFISVPNEAALDKALKIAQKQHKTVLLDVYADWCIACRNLDHTLFENEAVLKTLKNTVLLRLDLSEQTPDNLALQKTLRIVGPPTLIFFNEDTTEANTFRIVGSIESNDFIDHTRRFLITQPH